MTSAVITSALFLVCYVLHHITAPVYVFRGQGIIRPIYFVMLTSHVLLAIAVTPDGGHYIHPRAARLVRYGRLRSPQGHRPLDLPDLALRLDHGNHRVSDGLSNLRGRHPDAARSCGIGIWRFAGQARAAGTPGSAWMVAAGGWCPGHSRCARIASGVGADTGCGYLVSVVGAKCLPQDPRVACCVCFRVVVLGDARRVGGGDQRQRLRGAGRPRPGGDRRGHGADPRVGRSRRAGLEQLHSGSDRSDLFGRARPIRSRRAGAGHASSDPPAANQPDSRDWYRGGGSLVPVGGHLFRACLAWVADRRRSVQPRGYFVLGRGTSAAVRVYGAAADRLAKPGRAGLWHTATRPRRMAAGLRVAGDRRRSGAGALYGQWRRPGKSAFVLHAALLVWPAAAGGRSGPGDPYAHLAGAARLALAPPFLA